MSPLAPCRSTAAVLLLFALFCCGPAGAAPAEVLPLDVEQATRAWLDTVDSATRAKSDAYFEGGYWLLLWGTLVALLVDGLLLHTGWSARFSGWAQRVTRHPWLQPGLYAAPYVLVTWLLLLPWSLYRDFFRERAYGLMNQTLPAWLVEQLVSLAVTLVMFGLAVMAIYAVIRRLPRNWWLPGTGVTVALLLFALMLGPVFIQPLFNDYSELPAGPLRDEIISMAREQGVPADNVLVFNQSKQHDRISANVSGLGQTLRIALNDNLLEQGTPAEIKAVMGHELGHYVLHHVWLMVALLSVLLGTGFFIAARLAPHILARHGSRWGINTVADPASLPLLGMILTCYLFLATPASNSIIRVNESSADAFGLAVAQEPDGFASIAMKLATYRKLAPGPLEEVLFFDHPSGETRVRMAMTWKARQQQPAPAP